MANDRPEITWADYLAAAVAPVLIMALVGSLCFFLLEVGYGGDYPGTLKWIMFWFVLGSVMLARVSITQGIAHAGLLGLGLGGATALAVCAFVSPALVGCLVIGVVWWCAHKLTWNCTFNDDTVDPSAEGLLHTAGNDERWKERRIGTKDKARVYDPLSEDTFRREEKEKLQQASRWKRLWHALTDLEPKAHAPGLSVLYFSLAALPLFGLAQVFIPASDADAQSSAFQWLFIYLFSALALLLVTSFLGLRRYLRRRNLEMPAAMTTSWVGVGVAMLAALLIGALVLPLPSASNDWAVALRDRVLQSQQREASEIAPLKLDGTDSENENAAKTDQGESSQGQQAQQGEKGKAGGEQGQASETSEKSSGEQENQGSDGEGKASGGDKSGGDQGGDQSKSGDQSQGGDQQSKQPGGGNSPKGTSQSGPPQSQQQQQTQQGNQGSQSSAPTPPAHSPPSTPPNPLQALSGILRPLFWIVLIVMAVILAIVFRHQIIRFLREIADIWRGLWGLFFPSRLKNEVAEKSAAAPAFRPFASFANPFVDGRAARASTDELVKYTFAALEAWAYEHGAPHAPKETPMEFTTRIAATFPEVGQESPRVGGWLARSLYAREAPPKECVTALRTLWTTMQNHQGAALTAAH